MRIGRMMHKTVTGFGSGYRGFLLLLHVIEGTSGHANRDFVFCFQMGC